MLAEWYRSFASTRISARTAYGWPNLPHHGCLSDGMSAEPDEDFMFHP